MNKYLKLILIVMFGLALGLVVHGLIEILAIWLLTTRFNDFFVSLSWNTWLWVHAVFTIFTQALGIYLAFWLYKRYKK